MLPDLHTGFSRGRSGGLVFPSLSEFSSLLWSTQSEVLWHYFLFIVYFCCVFHFLYLNFASICFSISFDVWKGLCFCFSGYVHTNTVSSVPLYSLVFTAIWFVVFKWYSLILISYAAIMNLFYFLSFSLLSPFWLYNFHFLRIFDIYMLFFHFNGNLSFSHRPMAK